jgi:hypothetical protein
MIWSISYRADPESRVIADRHYNRQSPGAANFVPPGRCFVLKAPGAVWVTSWPFAEYVKHAWPGAWINSCFRKECCGDASEYIRQAISASLSFWKDAPKLGMVTFVDPNHVRPTKRRGKEVYGYCYMKAGFTHVGFTKGGLWAWQMLPSEMPPAEPAINSQFEFRESK